MAKKSSKAQPSVYQLKITLDGSKPPIWRRILVEADNTLEDLHDVIQRAMGWDSSHLHEFLISSVSYGAPDEDTPDDLKDESRFTLHKVLPGPKKSFKYIYDFGDGWQHTVLVEKLLPPEPGVEYPQCVAGARACPPEDCGGIGGYYNLLKTVSDPKDPEYESMIEWLGGDWDAEAFSIEDANARLHGGAVDKFADDEETDEIADRLLESPSFAESIERTLQAIREFTGIEDDAALAQYIEGLEPEEMAKIAQKQMAGDPKALAQQMALRALDADSVEEALGMAKEALELDPNCTDARLIQIMAGSKLTASTVDKLRDLVASTTEQLGEETLASLKGKFGKDLRFRSYFRVRSALRAALEQTGHVDEAITELIGLIALDPEDPFGCRFDLVSLTLVHRMLDHARDFMKQYMTRDGDESLWASILLDYLSGDLANAKVTLAMARARNPHVESYFMDSDEEPDAAPGEEELEDDALLCYERIGHAWDAHPLALQWLEAQAV